MSKTSTEPNYLTDATGTSIYHVLEQMYMDMAALCDRFPKSASYAHAANRILTLVSESLDIFVEGYAYPKFSPERCEAMTMLCQRLAALRRMVHLTYLRTQNGPHHPITPVQLANYDQQFFKVGNMMKGFIRTTCVNPEQK